MSISINLPPSKYEINIMRLDALASLIKLLISATITLILAYTAFYFFINSEPQRTLNTTIIAGCVISAITYYLITGVYPRVFKFSATRLLHLHQGVPSKGMKRLKILSEGSLLIKYYLMDIQQQKRKLSFIEYIQIINSEEAGKAQLATVK